MLQYVRKSLLYIYTDTVTDVQNPEGWRIVPKKKVIRGRVVGLSGFQQALFTVQDFLIRRFDQGICSRRAGTHLHTSCSLERVFRAGASRAQAPSFVKQP
jgi:hypothetical protein